jgi:hypothetical protein
MTTAESVLSQLEQHGYQVKRIAILASPEAGEAHGAYVVSQPTGLGRCVIIVRDGAAISFRVYVPLPGDVHDQTAALREWVGANVGAAKQTLIGPASRSCDDCPPAVDLHLN